MSGLNRILSAGMLGLFVVAGCVPAPSSRVGVPRDKNPSEMADAERADSPDSASGSHAAPAAEPGPDGPDAETEFTETSTGLKYRILRKGTGRKPTAIDFVHCHYRGTLDDGTVFDSSYGKGKAARFGLNGVIGGWTEGLQLIGEGGKIELEIPSQLGYGAAGFPPKIGPDSTLHFIVELNMVE